MLNPLFLLHRLSFHVNRLARISAGVFLGLMLAVVILQVIARYVFTSPPF